MRTIRGYLTRSLLTSLLLILVFCNVAIYLFISYRITSQVDSSMEAKARAFAGYIEQNPNGIEIELNEEFLPEFSRQKDAEYYQIWDDSGEELSRSPSLKTASLPLMTGPMTSPRYWNLTLPDGREGRAIGIRFQPRIDEENRPINGQRTGVQLVLARGRTQFSHALGVLFWGLLSVVLLVTAGIFITIPHVTEAGLSPLRKLAEETRAIDTKTLGFRYATGDLPEELLPVAQRLNELLIRLEGAFALEKKLTMDIAHELKTPLAELVALSEVAIAWPEDSEFVATALKDTQRIAEQMDNIISVILTLGRVGAGKMAVSSSFVMLDQLIMDLWHPWEPQTSARNISVDIGPLEHAGITTDKDILSSILSNLFGNAVEYCPPSGHIRFRLMSGGKGCLFSLVNSNNILTEKDMQHIFEFLWQKNPGGLNNSHSGLGLMVVENFSRFLDIDIKAELLESGNFSITLDIPCAIEQKS
jgi:signal transduction histidine kinase